MSDKYEIAVLGGGPAGYIAALRAAQLGARVALIEKDKIGGTCLNRGCIPTKAIIACTNLYDKMQQAANYGLSAGNIKLDPSKVIERKNKVIEKLVKGVEFLLEKNKITILRGEGKVLSSENLELISSDGRKSSVVCRKLIIATGSSSACIPGLAFDKKQFLSSDDLLECTDPPQKLDIVGGGVIGLHFAVIYAAMGAEITVYEALPEILPGIDEEVIASVKRILKRKNVEIKTNVKFTPKDSCGKTLISVGRTPNLSGLEALNLKIERRSVAVNEKQETSAPNVYAAGDICSKKMFAHVAYEQGLVAAENAIGSNRTFSYDCIPYGIYTHPEIGSAGMTEKEAREKYQDIKVGKFPFAALGIAAAMGETEGFVKVIADKDGKLLGVHILGAEATNLIGGATIAIKNGLSVERLAETWQAHPTYPEGLQEAALGALKRSLHNLN